MPNSTYLKVEIQTINRLENNVNEDQTLREQFMELLVNMLNHHLGGKLYKAISTLGIRMDG